MEANRPVTGRGKTPDKADQDAANKADPGTYDVSITATVEKDNRPQPNPIGDYKAEWTPKT